MNEPIFREQKNDYLQDIKDTSDVLSKKVSKTQKNRLKFGYNEKQQLLNWACHLFPVLNLLENCKNLSWAQSLKQSSDNNWIFDFLLFLKFILLYHSHNVYNVVCLLTEDIYKTDYIEWYGISVSTYKTCILNSWNFCEKSTLSFKKK